MKALNLNETIKVKLTDYGMDIYYHQWDALNARIERSGGKPITPHFPKVDAEGYSEFQLWIFINTYGEYMSMTAPNVIEPLNVYINEEDLDEVAERREDEEDS